MNPKIKILLAIGALLLVASALMPAAANNQGGLVAISAGNGKVFLFWFPPVGKWPSGGFRLANDQGKILADRISFAGPAEQSALTEEDRNILASLSGKLAAVRASAEITQLYSLAALKAAADPAFAKAAGLFWELSGVPAGPRKYIVSGLDANGRPTGLVLTSAAVDATASAPLPASPLGSASPLIRVALSWSENADKEKTYVVGYLVERGDGGAPPKLLTRKPVLMGRGRDESLPAFLDDTAPEEQGFSIGAAVDLVGRRAARRRSRRRWSFSGARNRFCTAEPTSPPGSRGRVALAWTPNPSPYPRKRFSSNDPSNHACGPFAAIAPKRIRERERGLEDRDVRAGTADVFLSRPVGGFPRRRGPSFINRRRQSRKRLQGARGQRPQGRRRDRTHPADLGRSAKPRLGLSDRGQNRRRGMATAQRKAEPGGDLRRQGRGGDQRIFHLSGHGRGFRQPNRRPFRVHRGVSSPRAPSECRPIFWKPTGAAAAFGFASAGSNPPTRKPEFSCSAATRPRPRRRPFPRLFP